MQMLQASDIKRFDNWTCLIYSEPGKGKTTMVKGLKGNTVLLSVDGMYHVLSSLKNVGIMVIDPRKPTEELKEFVEWAIKNKDRYDNIVIDNLSTYQNYWLNEASRNNDNGMPRIQDYGIIDRITIELIADLKKLNKNLLIFAHETQVEITKTNGGVYTQFQPAIRKCNDVMGIIPLVGRLVIDQEGKRIIVLQPTQATKAKDQLMGDRQFIGQMELLNELQK